MSLLRSIAQRLGLLPRPWDIVGRPDRDDKGTKKVSATVSPTKSEEDGAVQYLNWGSQSVRGKLLSHNGGFTWDREGQSEGSGLDANTKMTEHDVRAFTVYQARTKSFTWKQYETLRSLYLRQGNLTNRQVMVKMQMSRSWVEKRWPAVKQSIAAIKKDLAAGRPLPFR